MSIYAKNIPDVKSAAIESCQDRLIFQTRCIKTVIVQFIWLICCICLQLPRSLWTAIIQETTNISAKTQEVHNYEHLVHAVTIMY